MAALNTHNALISWCSCFSRIGKTWYGVDINNESIADNMNAFVWEPALIKINMLTAATEAGCLILSVDETVRNPQTEKPPQMGPAPPRRR